MKPKTMILMGLAITCGLGASYMTSRLLANRAPEETETVTILVAKANVNVGELLKKPEELFVTKTVNAKDVPEGAVKEVEALKDKLMKKSLRKGDHITPNELYGKDEQLDIPDGHGAVGMKVNLETTASGFASLPRSHVDILLTVRVNNNDINQSYVQVLLEDVLVLAADTDTGREKGIVAQAQVVTLALTPDDVKRVVGAKAMGELSLSLRKPGDHSRSEKTIMTFAEIKNSKNKQETAAAQKPRDEAPTYEAPKEIAKTTEPAKTTPKVEDPIIEAPPAPKLFRSNLDVQNGNQTTRTTTIRNEAGEVVDEGSEQPATQPQRGPRASTRQDS